MSLNLRSSLSPSSWSREGLHLRTSIGQGTLSQQLRGARAVAEGTVALASRSQRAELALVNGEVGIVLAPHGRLFLAITFTSEADRITSYDVVADPDRLSPLSLAVLSGER